MREKGRAALLVGLLGLLGACGEALPVGPGVIAGTVTAPPGGDVAGTVVVACFENLPDCEMLSTTVNGAGAAAPYRLTGLPAGSYGVYAFKDLDGNALDNGDYYGVYAPDPSEVAVVTPPASGIDIQMNVLRGVTRAAMDVPRAVQALARRAGS